MSQWTFIIHESGFDILPRPEGWRLQDTARFNNWGLLGNTFATKEEAADFARKCRDFKEGRRMTLR